VKLLLQRVSSASVAVDDRQIASIDLGLLVFVGVAPDDGSQQVAWLVDKLLGIRVFPGDNGRPMDRNVLDVGGEVLVVSQFTLAADINRGRRPSFSTAASPEHALEIYDGFVAKLTELSPVKSGIFGADMQVSLVNDGPVTFLLEK
jgi:D-tyrosyl-tRNA(Tyr) deacylase